VTAAMVADRPVARSLALDPEICFAVVVPDRELATSAARQVLPEMVPRADAVFNLGRLGLLVSGLADHHQLLATAGDDRLHQGHRSVLFPEAPALLAGLREAGALTSCWSGAGPSLLGICTVSTVATVAGAARAIMQGLGVAGDVLELGADLAGVQVTELD
jgi:homoserine kinase